MIIFRNPGLIDLRAAVTLGVNAKDSDNAIGFFGTGLKYAIAVLLRNKCSVVIYRGHEPYTFATDTHEIRGKAFDFITMSGKELGFTTDLGKNWEPWQAYRELYCNALDEHGGVQSEEDAYRDKQPLHEEDTTTIIVRGPAIEKAHDERHTFLLTDEPDFATEDGEIRFRPSHYVYYRGVRVGTLPLPSAFTYNILMKVELTEDRTLRNTYSLGWQLGGVANKLLNKSVIERMVCAPKGTFETALDFDYGKPSEAFLDVVESCMRYRKADLNATVLKNRRPSTMQPEVAKLNTIQQQQLATATDFCLAMGFPITDYEIVIVERLGDGVLGLASDNTIFITKQAFERGTKIVAGTLIEEFVHLREKVADYTRQFQDFFINRLISLGEEHIWRKPL